jgi:maleate isomerase
MYGWRGRIGVIIPATNATFEPECYRMAPEGVSFHFARMALTELSAEALQEMGKFTREKGRELAAAGVDVIVFGCTSGSFAGGRGHDEQIIRELQEETGIPALATSTAVRRALKRLGIQKMAVCSPYSEELNARLKTFFEADGLVVTAIRGLSFVQRTTHFPLASRPVSLPNLQPPEVAYKLARVVNGPEAQGILISCTNFRTIEIIEKLETDLEKPVVTSVQATVWAALRQIGVGEKLSGWGRLLTLSLQ